MNAELHPYYEELLYERMQRRKAVAYSPPAAPSGWYRFTKRTESRCRRCGAACVRVEGPLAGFVRGNCFSCGGQIPGFHYDTEDLLKAWERMNQP